MCFPEVCTFVAVVVRAEASDPLLGSVRPHAPVAEGYNQALKAGKCIRSDHHRSAVQLKAM